MRTSSFKNSLAIGLSIVLGASIFSVGVSHAAGTSITACAKKSNGAMRLVTNGKPCKKSERTITWGSQGDTGAMGPSGSTGASGISGSNGYSDALVFRNSQNAARQSFQNIEVITAANIPAGKYVWSVSMQVNFVNPTGGSSVIDSEPNYFGCFLSKSNNPADSDSTNVIWPISGSGVLFKIAFEDAAISDYEHKQSFAANGALELSDETSLYLMCQYEGGALTSDSDRVMVLRYPTMTLTKVNTLS